MSPFPELKHSTCANLRQAATNEFCRETYLMSKLLLSDRGVATGGIWVYILPKSVQVNFLWDKNDVRTATEYEY